MSKPDSSGNGQSCRIKFPTSIGPNIGPNSPETLKPSPTLAFLEAMRDSNLIAVSDRFTSIEYDNLSTLREITYQGIGQIDGCRNDATG